MGASNLQPNAACYLGMLLGRFPKLRSIEISHQEHFFTAQAFQSLLEGFGEQPMISVEELRFQSSNIHPEAWLGFGMLVASCPELKEVLLNNTSFGTTISLRLIMLGLGSCQLHKLERFDMSN